MTSMIIKILHYLVGLPRIYKQAIVLMVDIGLCALSVWLSFSLRLGLWNFWDGAIQQVMVLSIAIMVPVFLMSGIYRSIFRYAGSGTIAGIAKATIVLALVMMIVVTIYTLPGVPRTIGALQPLIFFVLVCLTRITGRYLMVDILGQTQFSGVSKNVLIYGAGASGQQLAAALRHEPGMMVRGFVDDDVRLDGQKLDGIRVTKPSKLPKLVEKAEVTDILLALPSMSRRARKEVVERLEPLSVHVKTLPNMRDIVDGVVSSQDLRELDIEDLLGREPVAPNELLLAKTIAAKTVLVTGAGGSIGGELCRQIVRLRPKKLILVEVTEYTLYAIENELRAMIANSDEASDIQIIPVLTSVIDKNRMFSVFAKCRPDTVFHTAAYKHVPLVESNPIAGMNNNIFGTYITALAAREHGVSDFILVSTDKAVRPTNVMGASKRVCELVLQAFADKAGVKTKFAMVRFGNVLGSSGSVVPLFKRQIESGGPITLTHKDVTRYFMTISEAAQLVIQAGAMAKGGEVYVLDMGKSVKISDLATMMVNLSGLTIRDEENPSGDIEILEVGLRPGEKLYEELLIGDNPEPTANKRIMRANEVFIKWPRLTEILDQLEVAIATEDEGEVFALLEQLVPEYEVTPNETLGEVG